MDLSLTTMYCRHSKDRTNAPDTGPPPVAGYAPTVALLQYCLLQLLLYILIRMLSCCDIFACMQRAVSICVWSALLVGISKRFNHTLISEFDSFPAGFPIMNDPLYNHPAWGPKRGKGGEGIDNVDQVSMQAGTFTTGDKCTLCPDSCRNKKEQVQ